MIITTNMCQKPNSKYPQISNSDHTTAFNQKNMIGVILSTISSNSCFSKIIFCIGLPQKFAPLYPILSWFYHGFYAIIIAILSFLKQVHHDSQTPNSCYQRPALRQRLYPHGTPFGLYPSRYLGACHAVYGA
ncbi:hypothetical protein [Moraxella lacunata]|uniref:hypothetical protein n=1 Tax=Moraxella lacunata TaxID=477 RepID=UPI003EDF8506